MPLSKHEFLRCATNAASAAIDYSKGNEDDGVVDSPPSRVVKTPLCSPSPLKRESWIGVGCFSPSPQTEAGTSRKLDLTPTVGAQLNFEGCSRTLGNPSSAVVDCIEVSDSPTSKRPASKTSVAPEFPRVDDNQPRPTFPTKTRRLLPAGDSIHTQRFIRNSRRVQASKSTASNTPCTNTVHTLLPKPSRGSKSHSTSEAALRVRKVKPKAPSRSVEVIGVQNSASTQQYYSRREDIYRGLAKLRALQEKQKNCIDNGNA